MSTLTNSSQFLPPIKLETELWPKIIEMVNYVTTNAENDIKDAKYKWTDPNQISADAIKEIIEERGYQYIRSIIDIVTDLELSSLVKFLAMINLLKGSRDGLEVVMKLMGIEAVITEWWEVNPARPPFTFRIELNFTTAYASVIAELGAKLRVFYRNYVYPLLEQQKIVFSDTLAEQTWAMAGYSNAGIGGELQDDGFGAWMFAGYGSAGVAGTIDGGVV